ncbi:hypothetical protein AOT81_07030 [Xylella fastidiosa]|nr:hypothetical protein AOT81_07030 [Xylella fastidiosa]RWA44640.1 hypothetical protein XfCFBP8356_04790 [Xylella fastidiosa subsp. sandyi]
MLSIFLVKGVGDCSLWRYHYLFMLDAWIWGWVFKVLWQLSGDRHGTAFFKKTICAYVGMGA